MSDTKLKPCPFCGCSAEIKEVTCNDVKETIAQCSGCKIHSPVFFFGNDAVSHWNKRNNK